jgi:PEGA domain.
MKKIKNIIGSFLEKKCQIVLFFGMLALGVNAQDLEKLYITVNPPGSIMSINGSTISLNKDNQPYSLELKKGTYPIELWAPGYELVKDTIVIKETTINKYTNKYAKLLTVKTPEFENFEKLDHIYNKKVKGKRNKKIGLITLNALLTYYVLDGDRFRINKFETRANNAYNEYISAVDQSNLEEEFNKYNVAQKKHNDIVDFAKTKLIVGIPVLIGTYIGTWITIKKINKKPLPVKPVFNPKNPFVGSTLKLGAESYGGNYKVGLKITF